MQNVLVELHYMPCVAYFAAIMQSDEIILERHENFVKQSYRNRSHVNTANGLERLIVPLIKPEGKISITDVRIDYSQKWLNNHWRTIQSAYGKAPYFEYYSDDLHNILFKNTTYLYELNLSLLTLCLSWLKCTVPVKESLTYEKETTLPILDLRSAIHPKKEDNLTFIPYTQVFGNKFVPNLSIIDLIFCLGPGSRDNIRLIHGK